MKLLQINTTVNSGSTGRITEDIGKVAIENGHSSYIVYGRGNRESKSKLIRVGSKLDFYKHAFRSLVLDQHGFGSKKATHYLTKRIEIINPDVVGLHNLHGYYINIEKLFSFLKAIKKPVLWTLFDCWSFTGHCSYFEDVGCEKWMTHCSSCPKKSSYPRSLFFDNSKENFKSKSLLFNEIPKMVIVVHSNWLKGLVQKSFLKNYPIKVIRSGIDLDVFKPIKNQKLREKYKVSNKKVVLGCASIWDKRKGLSDFFKINKILPHEYQIVLIGLSKKQLKDCPTGIIGISRTENVTELAEWYSVAKVFINPTYQDNFPTTNLESLACGTPVVTYNTGGSPEAVCDKTGRVVEKGNIEKLMDAIEDLCGLDERKVITDCRARAVTFYNKDDRYLEYLNIYNQMIDK